VELVVSAAGPPAPAPAPARVTAQAYRLDGALLWSGESEPLLLPAQPAFALLRSSLVLPPFDSIVFVRMALDGAIGSRNVYWLCPDGGDFAELEEWRTAGTTRLSLALKPLQAPLHRARYTARVVNTGATVAFFVRLSLRRLGRAATGARAARVRALLSCCASPAAADENELQAPLLADLPAASPFQPAAADELDERVLPVTWSDNYVTLLPGEALDITFDWDVRVAGAAAAACELQASGWNTPLVREAF
jgi:hypothetical protein